MNFLHVDRPEGATACILIGRWHPQLPAPPEAGNRALWLVDPAGAGSPPSGNVTVQTLASASGAEVEAALEHLFHHSPKALPSLYITPHLPAEYADVYAATIDAVRAALESQHRARVTRQADAFTWQTYLYSNLADYLERRLPAAWENALAGLPAIVAGAGPSLDHSIDALAAAADGAVVFAADSALRALTRRGIRTDFAVSVDVAKTPAKCLPADTFGFPGRVILAPTSPADWKNALPGESRFYLSAPQLTLDWLETRGVTRPSVSVRENCGATALELARFLGCSPIYLFGMDLALDDADLGHRHHAGADVAAYTESGFNPAQDFPRVPGNFSPTVPTHVLGDWRTLDARLATWPPDRVFAVTDRGARLSHVTVIAPGNFRGEQTPGVHKLDLLSALATPTPVPQPTRESINADLLGFAGVLSRVTRSLQEADVPTMASALRALLQTPGYARMLGACALKLLPRLLPPFDPDPALWRANVEEIAALGATICQQANRA